MVLYWKPCFDLFEYGWIQVTFIAMTTQRLFAVKGKVQYYFLKQFWSVCCIDKLQYFQSSSEISHSTINIPINMFILSVPHELDYPNVGFNTRFS